MGAEAHSSKQNFAFQSDLQTNDTFSREFANNVSRTKKPGCSSGDLGKHSGPPYHINKTKYNANFTSTQEISRASPVKRVVHLI